MERKPHHSTEMEANLSAQIGKALTDSFNVKILCHKYSENGNNQYIRLCINGVKPVRD